MRKGHVDPLMNTTLLLNAAWPQSTAKHIAAGIGCTHRQARRMLTTGKIPARFKAILVALLDRQIEENRQTLEAFQLELRHLDGISDMASASDRLAHRVGEGS